jgi:hypothetical protein
VGSVYHTGASHWVRRRPPPSPRTSGSVSRAPCSETTHSTRNTAQPKHARYTTAGAGRPGRAAGGERPDAGAVRWEHGLGDAMLHRGEVRGEGGGRRARAGRVTRKRTPSFFSRKAQKDIVGFDARTASGNRLVLGRPARHKRASRDMRRARVALATLALACGALGDPTADYAADLDDDARLGGTRVAATLETELAAFLFRDEGEDAREGRHTTPSPPPSALDTEIATTSAEPHDLAAGLAAFIAPARVATPPPPHDLDRAFPSEGEDEAEKTLRGVLVASLTSPPPPSRPPPPPHPPAPPPSPHPHALDGEPTDVANDARNHHIVPDTARGAQVASAAAAASSAPAAALRLRPRRVLLRPGTPPSPLWWEIEWGTLLAPPAPPVPPAPPLHLPWLAPSPPPPAAAAAATRTPPAQRSPPSAATETANAACVAVPGDGSRVSRRRHLRSRDQIHTRLIRGG